MGTREVPKSFVVLFTFFFFFFFPVWALTLAIALEAKAMMDFPFQPLSLFHSGWEKERQRRREGEEESSGETHAPCQTLPTGSSTALHQVWRSCVIKGAKLGLHQQLSTGTETKIQEIQGKRQKGLKKIHLKVYHGIRAAVINHIDWTK